MDDKVYVSAVPGMSALGRMDPKVGMVTHLGTITSIDSGSLMVAYSGAGTDGMNQRAHTAELHVFSGHAFYSHAWPTGDGSILFGTQGVYPTSKPVGQSGIFWATGGGVQAKYES